ncbi:RNA polymerase sigma factor [Pseudonocardia lacus]|uniref:RNA polymerase sigma factor n=1 Tax=Pseudonocardia lacus TaxID=2835865 RepID=UPI0027E2E140|nr:RNA polymerase sigma factor [Pseudonocardia lacus]
MDAGSLDDHTLWAAAAGGDGDAFTALYHRHADAVWRHAYRLTGTRSTAEDVLAATFLTAWRRRSELRFAADSARPWLLAVAGNEARTEWRRSARHERLARRVGAAPAERDHSDAVVARLDDRRRLHRVLEALGGLPDRLREAAELCMVAGVPQADAARALGIAEVTLRSRVHRARARLRAQLAEEELR